MALSARGRPNVERLARRGNLDALRAALRYREPVDDDGVQLDAGVAVRVRAAGALERFDSAEVAGDLGAALGDPEPEVRLAAIEGLSRLGVRTAGQVPRLVRCVAGRAEGAERVSSRALEVLADWRAQGSAEALAAVLLEPDAPEADEGHRAALDLLLAVDLRGPHAARSAVTDMLVATLGDRSAQPGEDTAVRMLGWIGESALDKVRASVENGGASPALLRAAGRLGDARMVDPIVRALASHDPEMRRAAAAAARTLNHTRAVPALVAATRDSEQPVRDAAGAALDRMGTAAMVAGVAAIINEEAVQAEDGDELPELVETDVLPAGELQDEAPAEPEAPVQVVPEPPALEAPRIFVQRAPHEPAAEPRRGGRLARLFGRDH